MQNEIFSVYQSKSSVQKSEKIHVLECGIYLPHMLLTLTSKPEV